MRGLVAIPVYNERKTLPGVLADVLPQGADVLVVDDGSRDNVAEVLVGFPEVRVLRHPRNRGYGAALRTAFDYALAEGYDAVVTFDSDGQHDAALIPEFLRACADTQIVSGSRYRESFAADTPAPADRRRINMLLTDQVNALLGLDITDAFCGFKGHRADALRRMRLTEDGYALPMEFWVQVACQRLSLTEIAVPRVYLDPSRSFGTALDDSDARLRHYQAVFDRALGEARRRHGCGIAQPA